MPVDVVAENIAFGVHRGGDGDRARSASSRRRTSCTRRCSSSSCSPAAPRQFILLGQEFVAWVQVLVYIGAVIVLFLFGIMLTRAPMHPDGVARQQPAVAGRSSSSLFLGGILAALLDRRVRRHEDRARRADPHRSRSRTRSSANYIIPFEVVGVLLLAALIGAVVLARKD